tara:strand:- start:240 stop:893 length:654 start_codon:yes stop_codon:yes gene_type:complete
MRSIIYLRTSTEEQNPQNQLKDCEKLVKKLNINNYEVLEDKVSAWKDIDRKNFDLIKKAIERKEVETLICWDLDRLYRNRKRLIEFFELCKIYNCKIHSFRQKWLEELNDIPKPFNEIMHNLMLSIMGWLAEEESIKKSMRVKSAVRKKGNKTISYKGNKWGRKSLSNNIINQVLELSKQKLSIRKIAKQVFYWDKNNNKKQISIAGVHKIIKQHNN